MEQHIPRHITQNTRRNGYAGMYHTSNTDSTTMPADILHRYQSATPLLFISVIIEGIGLGIGLTAIYFNSRSQTQIADILVSVGIVLLGVGAIPFILGVYLLLRKPAVQNHRCGMCRFYHPESTSYDLGQCHRNDIHMTTRLHACEGYVFSERAMARERLSTVEERKTHLN